MVAVPAATPVTVPVDETVATFGLLDVHVTTRPDSTVPLASVGVAVSDDDAPTPRVTALGEMLTALTANEAAVTATVAVPV